MQLLHLKNKPWSLKIGQPGLFYFNLPLQLSISVPPPSLLLSLFFTQLLFMMPVSRSDSSYRTICQGNFFQSQVFIACVQTITKLWLVPEFNFVCAQAKVFRVIKLHSIFHRSWANNSPLSKKCPFLCHNVGIHSLILRRPRSFAVPFAGSERDRERPWMSENQARAYTDRLRSVSAFVCTRIKPDLTTFGRGTYRGSVPLKYLRLTMSSKNSQHVALCVTAQHFLKMSKTSKYNMYRYWSAVSVGYAQ